MTSGSGTVRVNGGETPGAQLGKLTPQSNPELTAWMHAHLRVATIGASHALIGETDRMIGEVLAAKGDLEGATERFDRAVRLTRVGFGPEHPRTWFADLSMARHQTRLGRPQEALAALETLARHEGGGSEAPKLRWLARGYQAEARCRMGERERAQRDLDALAAELRSAQPDGGVIPREIAAIRSKCGKR